MSQLLASYDATPMKSMPFHPSGKRRPLLAYDAAAGRSLCGSATKISGSGPSNAVVSAGSDRADVCGSGK